MRTKIASNAEFSMSQLGADFAADTEIANFARNRNAPSSPGNYRQTVRQPPAKVGGGIGGMAKNAADAIGKAASTAKSKVAVLVKGANGKVFVQQRWKNAQDMAGNAKDKIGKAAAGANDALNKAYAKNPNAVRAGALGAGLVTGLAVRKLISNSEQDKPKSQRLFPND